MRPLLTPRWLLRHGIALLMVLACAALAWWQVTRAIGGNALSFGYALLWPVFGLFVIVIWWREARLAVRGEPVEQVEPVLPAGFRAPVITRHVNRVAPADDAGSDPALMAYNEYLARLNADPGARPAGFSRSE